MKPAEGTAHRPGAKSTAEAAELRKHLGEGGPGNCGRTAEELRKLSTLSSLYALPSFLLPALPGLLTPSLVRTNGPAKPRESLPAAPPHAGRARPAPDAGAYLAARYGVTRHWCVMQGPDLVAVVAYRKGAAELVRRLNATAGAGAAP